MTTDWRSSSRKMQWETDVVMAEAMEEVSRYRECFARLLVAGSELRKLKVRAVYAMRVR